MACVTHCGTLWKLLSIYLVGGAKGWLPTPTEPVCLGAGARKVPRFLLLLQRFIYTNHHGHSKGAAACFILLQGQQQNKNTLKETLKSKCKLKEHGDHLKRLVVDD